MEETSIGRGQPLIAHNQAAEMAEPGEGPFNDPPPPIPPQLTPILMGGPLMVAAGRDNRLDAAPGQAGTQRVAVIPAIGDQPLRPFAGASWLAWAPNCDGVERPFAACDFRWGSRLQGLLPTEVLAPSTRTIHFVPLPRLVFPTLAPPFFAGTKLPSAKHSSQRSFCRSLSWARKARQSLRSTPVSSQALSRRQPVLGLPDRRGSSRHWAPVQRIQRMPSKQRRSATRGRPPRGDPFDSGKWTRMASQCCFVSPCHAMSCLLLLPGNSWRDDTLTGRF
jgi:hypothetical protein